MADVSRKGFIKAKDLKTGDEIKFTSEGGWVKKDFSKGQKGTDIKDVFEIAIKLNEEKPGLMIINRTSLDSLAGEWGCDTRRWVGKSASVGFVDMIAFGERKKVLCLKPMSPYPEDKEGQEKVKKLVDTFGGSEAGWKES